MTYIHNTKIEFEHIRNNQLELLRKMVEKSVLRTTIRYLNMGLENTSRMSSRRVYPKYQSQPQIQ